MCFLSEIEMRIISICMLTTELIYRLSPSGTESEQAHKCCRNSLTQTASKKQKYSNTKNKNRHFFVIKIRKYLIFFLKKKILYSGPTFNMWNLYTDLFFHYTKRINKT